MSQKLLQKLQKKTNIIGGVVRLLLSIAPSSPQTPRSKAGGFSFTEKYHVRQKTNEAHEEANEARQAG
jgi:hypothetical protein